MLIQNVVIMALENVIANSIEGENWVEPIRTYDLERSNIAQWGRRLRNSNKYDDAT